MMTKRELIDEINRLIATSAISVTYRCRGDLIDLSACLRGDLPWTSQTGTKGLSTDTRGYVHPDVLAAIEYYVPDTDGFTRTTRHGQ